MLCLTLGLFFLYLAASDSQEDLYHPPVVLIIMLILVLLTLGHEVFNAWLYGLGRLELSRCPIYAGDEFDTRWVVPPRLLGKGKVQFCLRRISMKTEGRRSTLYQVYRDCRYLDLPTAFAGGKSYLNTKFQIPEAGPATRVGWWQGTYWQMVITAGAEGPDKNRRGFVGRIKNFISLCNPFRYRRTFILPVERKENGE
jgi:hypothetical protein